MRLFTLSVFFFCTSAGSCLAQLAVQFERSGYDETLKFFRGDEFSYQLLEDDIWRTDLIQEIRPDINSLVFANRYVSLDQIEQINLGKDGFTQGSGIALMTFGAGWGFFGLVGYAVDGDPETRFQTGDAIVSLGSIAAGFLLTKLANRKIKLSPNKRLRIVDLNF
ncbi:MAG: hypothetical protein AAF741_14695 [Bacteroidota bacterium]